MTTTEGIPIVVSECESVGKPLQEVLTGEHHRVKDRGLTSLPWAPKSKRTYRNKVPSAEEAPVGVGGRPVYKNIVVNKKKPAPEKSGAKPPVVTKTGVPKLRKSPKAVEPSGIPTRATVRVVKEQLRRLGTPMQKVLSKEAHTLLRRHEKRTNHRQRARAAGGRAGGWERDLTQEGVEPNPGPTARHNTIRAAALIVGLRRMVHRHSLVPYLTDDKNGTGLLIVDGAPHAFPAYFALLAYALPNLCDEYPEQFRYPLMQAHLAELSSVMPGWIRDLTREGVEPNPGPPKKGGYKVTRALKTSMLPCPLVPCNEPRHWHRPARKSGQPNPAPGAALRKALKIAGELKLCLNPQCPKKTPHYHPKRDDFFAKDDIQEAILKTESLRGMTVDEAMQEALYHGDMCLKHGTPVEACQHCLRLAIEADDEAKNGPQLARPDDRAEEEDVQLDDKDWVPSEGAPKSAKVWKSKGPPEPTESAPEAKQPEQDSKDEAPIQDAVQQAGAAVVAQSAGKDESEPVRSQSSSSSSSSSGSGPALAPATSASSSSSSQSSGTWASLCDQDENLQRERQEYEKRKREKEAAAEAKKKAQQTPRDRPGKVVKIHRKQKATEAADADSADDQPQQPAHKRKVGLTSKEALKAKLATLPPDEAKQAIGELLFNAGTQSGYQNVGKLVGMLLELDSDELVDAYYDAKKLTALWNRAVAALDLEPLRQICPVPPPHLVKVFESESPFAVHKSLSHAFFEKMPMDVKHKYPELCRTKSIEDMYRLLLNDVEWEQFIATLRPPSVVTLPTTTGSRMWSGNVAITEAMAFSISNCVVLLSNTKSVDIPPKSTKLSWTGATPRFSGKLARQAMVIVKTFLAEGIPETLAVAKTVAKLSTDPSIGCESLIIESAHWSQWTSALQMVTASNSSVSVMQPPISADPKLVNIFQGYLKNGTPPWVEHLDHWSRDLLGLPDQRAQRPLTVGFEYPWGLVKSAGGTPVFGIGERLLAPIYVNPSRLSTMQRKVYWRTLGQFLHDTFLRPFDSAEQSMDHMSCQRVGERTESLLLEVTQKHATILGAFRLKRPVTNEESENILKALSYTKMDHRPISPLAYLAVQLDPTTGGAPALAASGAPNEQFSQQVLRTIRLSGVHALLVATAPESAESISANTAAYMNCRSAIINCRTNGSIPCERKVDSIPLNAKGATRAMG